MDFLLSNMHLMPRLVDEDAALRAAHQARARAAQSSGSSKVRPRVAGRCGSAVCPCRTNRPGQVALKRVLLLVCMHMAFQAGAVAEGGQRKKRRRSVRGQATEELLSLLYLVQSSVDRDRAVQAAARWKQALDQGQPLLSSLGKSKSLTRWYIEPESGRRRGGGQLTPAALCPCR